MQFFNQYFKLEGVSPSNQGEYTVLCPFEHKDRDGNPYTETHPSAHINEAESLLHCKSCGAGISEASFVSRIEGISYREALEFLDTLNKSDNSDWSLRVEHLKNNDKLLNELQVMGIESQIDPLRLGYTGGGVDFPVFVYGELLDVRNYDTNRKPKVLSRTGAKNLILPFDLWREDERPTILAAGEKDMAILRAEGFNAITFTGGEQSFPKLFKYSFKERKVYIAYDNDTAGIDGALKAAYALKEAGATPYIVTGHHAVCTEKGGDIHDFFKKYGKTATDLKTILNATLETEEIVIERVKNEVFPEIAIAESSKGMYVDKRMVRSRVSITSIYEDMYSIPDYVRFTKTRNDEEATMSAGDTVEWVLSEDNLGDILYLMDSNLTQLKRDKDLRRLSGIPKDEKSITMTILSKTNIWKVIATDIIRSASDDNVPAELLVYVVGDRLMAGKKYEMLFKPVSHPLDGMRVVGISTKSEDIDTNIQNFAITDVLKQRLQVFQVQSGESVAAKMEEFVERAKGFIGVEARREVTLATDLFYHTPLEFKIGKRIERAYLDVMIVGDPRTMKSATAKAMQGVYDLGTITSLKTATIAGLIGGSDNVGGKGWKTKIGLLPQSHRGAVIMEEFSGGGRETISKLTEIRSSNRVRITRVNGTTDVPAMVRMLAISNPATNGGTNLTLQNYPSGIHVIRDLVGASEDIARYDFFLLVDEPEGYISPLDMFDLEPFDKDAYQDRIRWVWSRTKDQVELTRPVAEYLVKEAAELNKLYDTHIKLFGAEAWKKVARIAIACAGMCVSTDADFEKIVVTREHVDFAVYFLKEIYVNDIFKLDNYVANERSYSVCRPEDIHTLQDIYNSHSAMLEQMSISVEMSQRQLQVMSGLDQNKFSGVVNNLAASKFIQWQGEKIIPTNKFRKAMKSIGTAYLEKASER